MRIVYKGNYIRMTCGEIGLVMVKINYSVNLKGTNRGIDKEKVARGIKNL